MSNDHHTRLNPTTQHYGYDLQYDHAHDHTHYTYDYDDHGTFVVRKTRIIPHTYTRIIAILKSLRRIRILRPMICSRRLYRRRLSHRLRPSTITTATHHANPFHATNHSTTNATTRTAARTTSHTRLPTIVAIRPDTIRLLRQPRMR